MKPKKIGTVSTVDIQTGEVKEVKQNAFTLLPPPEDTCQVCATDHSLDAPHNQESLYYQYHFHSEHGRFPNWTDAMAHCADATKAAWRSELRKTYVAHGEAIPDDLKEDAPPSGR